MRSTAKGVVEALLLHGGPAQLARVARRKRALVLAYHNILPNGVSPCGAVSLHLPQSVFAKQLDLLAEKSQVVPLQQVLEEPASGVARPRVAITFDDAYQGAVTVGVAELARRALPATIFVAPQLLGGKSPWWDALPDANRDWALEELRGEDVEIRRWAEGSGLHRFVEMPQSCATASEDELRQALDYDGITLGSHSWSHANLARLTPAELEAELVRPLQWLEERFRPVSRWLAYPYGRFSPAVVEAVTRAGYRAALKIQGGWVPRRVSDPFALPRLNVPAGLSSDGFALRLAGLFCR